MEVLAPEPFELPKGPMGDGYSLAYSTKSQVQKAFSKSRSASATARKMMKSPTGEMLNGFWYSSIHQRLSEGRYRPISLWGEEFQGKWNTDWHDVSHISSSRDRFPWMRGNIQLKEFGRTRNVGPLNDEKLPEIIRCGSQCMIP
eukprot:g7515.t1